MILEVETCSCVNHNNIIICCANEKVLIWKPSYGNPTFAQKAVRSGDLRNWNSMNSYVNDVVVGSVTNIHKGHLKQTFPNVTAYGLIK